MLEPRLHYKQLSFLSFQSGSTFASTIKHLKTSGHKWNDSSLIFSCSWGGRGEERNHGCEGKMGKKWGKKHFFPLSFHLLCPMLWFQHYLLSPSVPCHPSPQPLHLFFTCICPSFPSISHPLFTHLPPSLFVFVHPAILWAAPGPDIWRSPLCYCHPLTQLSLGITDTQRNMQGCAPASDAGDRTRHWRMLGVQRARKEIWYSVFQTDKKSLEEFMMKTLTCYYFNWCPYWQTNHFLLIGCIKFYKF